MASTNFLADSIGSRTVKMVFGNKWSETGDEMDEDLVVICS